MLKDAATFLRRNPQAQTTMPLPTFTPEESYLIHAVKSERGTALSYMWGYLVGGMIMCSFALAYNSLALMASGFAVVCGFRIYEEVLQNRWLPLWRSILA